MNPYGPQMYGAPQRHCPACRADNPVANTFCSGCGASLPAALDPNAFDAPAAHVAQGPAWGCPACRHENQAHYAFCLGCGAARNGGGGAAFERRNPYDGNPATSQPRSPVALIIVVVVVVLIVMAAGLAGVAAMFLAR